MTEGPPIHPVPTFELNDFIWDPMRFQELFVVRNHAGVGKLIPRSVGECELDIAKERGRLIEIRIACKQASPHHEPVGAR